MWDWAAALGEADDGGSALGGAAVSDVLDADTVTVVTETTVVTKTLHVLDAALESEVAFDTAVVLVEDGIVLGVRMIKDVFE